ncbi:MAG: hypothetical protein M3253_03380, partial [Chloroflexota bacterium]|nr:hypothetical protein [Chloroflexota bacterium]
DGAWFVPLAPLNDPGLVPSAVATVLGLKEDPALPTADVVARHIVGRDLLLILDNFEHLLEASTVIPDWLAAAPTLRLLVTSRAVLRLSFELEFPVPPLSLPAVGDDQRAMESEAVRLFLERAAAAQAGFAPDDAALTDVARICNRLDGLPLALELAAARTKLLPPAAILDRLEHNLEVLSHGPLDVPDRHRSLGAALAWSHDLLSDTEKRFLRQLAVFKGGWGLDAAEAVTRVGRDSQLLELCASLLDKSLIQRHPSGPSPRYEMLETLREYGLERLKEAGELEATRQRHALWFVALAEKAQPLLTGSEQRPWLDRLEQDHDNLRAALRWAIDAEKVDIGFRLAIALWRFWQIRGHIGEGRRWLAELLERATDAAPPLHAAGLSAAGSLAYWQQDMSSACDLYEASLVIRRALGDPHDLAEGLYDLGWALTVPGAPTTDQPRARELGRQALQLFREAGDKAGEAKATWLLAWNAQASGDNVKAVEQLAHSVELFRALDDPFGLAWALHLLGMSALALDRIQLAETSWREALEVFSAADDTSGIDTALDDMATIAVMRGQPERALRLAAAAARLGQASGSRITELVRQMGHRTLTGGRRLSEEMVQAEWRAGESMTTAEAVAYALQRSEGTAESGLHRLRIYALGPMRVERDGVPIRRWGGEKAGSRQAQAIFAFLFDRGPRGLTKDEVTELIWPELPIQRADLAFHRTLGGLRNVLERDAPDVPAITYAGGHYRLNPALLGWSDVDAFEERLSAAATLEGDEAIAALEEARRLYRGDFMDDCPIYGDSAHVEERRSYLRGRLVDALVALAGLYERAGDLVAATAGYRQALAVSPASGGAAGGLERLGVHTAL